jgi:ABC-type multidrug transport system ATPase subunit
MNMELSSGNNYVILGANGSGKSTLMQVIAGNQLCSEGSIVYSSGKEIGPELFFREISVAAPYLELIEEFTLRESIRFHSRFKKMRNGMDEEKIIECCYLGDSSEKQLKYFSSGMKQRVRLALAILSDTPVLLLDEPCSNLDPRGIEWYRQLVSENKKDRLVIVCSNRLKDEYDFCNMEINVEAHK